MTEVKSLCEIDNDVEIYLVSVSFSAVDLPVSQSVNYWGLIKFVFVCNLFQVSH